MDNFGPHLELLWSSLQKWEPYLNGSFCNLQESKYDHNWQTYDECEKCNNAEQDFVKYTFSSDMKTLFEKVLKNDLAMYITSDEDIIELMNKIGYLEIVIKYIDLSLY